MKKIFLSLSCCLLLFGSQAQVNHQVSQVNTGSDKLTAADWQADIRFLQHTVHKDYPFLFKNTSATAFDAAVDKLHAEVPSLQPHERLAGIARLVASFKYGHTDIGWRQSPVKYHVVPINFYWFSDGIYVEGTDKNFPNLPGAKLLRVEGKPVKEVLEALRPLVPAENDQYVKAYGLDFLVIPEALHAQGVSPSLKSTITYTFEKDGKTFDQAVPSRDAFQLPRSYGFISRNSGWITVRDTSSTPAYLANLDKIYYYSYLPEKKTLYVRQSQVQDDPSENLAAFYKKVFDFVEKNDVEKLVIDVRLNGGGNNYKNKPVVTGIIESKKINQPGKLFVIIGRRTFSACQNLVNELSNYTNALFVGEPTAENINFYGDNRRVELPNTKIPVFLSFAWWQDKPQWENAPWLAPYVAVDMSFNDYKTNKDPALQACLDFSGKEIILDPMGHLRDLFYAGDMAALETEARKMTTDPRYRYVNFEDKINQSGYQLLNAEKSAEAVAVFELNTKLYPKSANTWDSLGEALWKSKNAKNAIDAYNKAIELDPNGVTGANAREMMKKIKVEQAQ
jgi:tetratricopeptide (TPR) repeat protein